MKRRVFIIATACLSTALAAPGLLSAKEKMRLERLTDHGKLMAKFVKFANDPSAQSYWEVVRNKKSLFKVTVDQIIRADPEQSYSEIATWQFGKLILKSIRNKGLERTKAILGVYGDLRGLANDDHIQYMLVNGRICIPEDPCLDTENCPRCKTFPSGSGG